MDQNIPQGYKQTKVGVIPEEWDVVKLGEVSTFYKGKGISKKDISLEGTPCIRYGELYTKYNEKIEKVFSKTSILKNNLFLSKSNDILIPASGETAIDLATASCILQDDIGLGGDINIIRTSMNGIFLSYYLNIIAKIRIASLAQGVSVIHLYSSQLKSLLVPIPPIKEQQKIAQILTTWDEAISKQEQLITTKERLKKGLMQKLLSGEVRFEGFDWEWEEVKLKEVTKVNQGLQIPISKRHVKDGENRYFYITVKFLKSNTKERYFIENPQKSVICTENDILMTRTGSTGMVITNVAGVFHNNFFKINFNQDKLFRDFLLYFLKSEYTQFLLKTYAGTTTIPDLTHSDFYSIKIKLPSKQEQQKIAKLLTLADKEIELLKKELETLKEQKHGLMQRLLTGEVRVKV